MINREPQNQKSSTAIELSSNIGDCFGDLTDAVQDYHKHAGEQIEDPAGTASPFPKMEDRPRYVILDDWQESGDGKKHRPGVYFCGMTQPKNDTPATEINKWFCTPLHVSAITFDGQNHNYGRLIRYLPTVGPWAEFALPMEDLAGDCVGVRGGLMARGVELCPILAKHHLPSYIQSEHPKKHVQCALQVGWHGDSFVLPDSVIGPSAGAIIFQSGERAHAEHTQAGTLAGWQAGIAAKAPSNPLLILAIAAAFAGPLLKRCNVEGGGLHFVGDSSTGKTTLIEASCSVWGGSGFKRSWRATSNGMEGAAAIFNDCLLALDEISECDPREVGAIIYALGNGRGKQRASRSGNARGITTWRCFVLSSGERTITTAMAEGGHTAKSGQNMRLLDVPAAQKYGAWNELHGAASPAGFSDALKQAAALHHGKAGRAFLEKLSFDDSNFCADLEAIKALPQFATDSSEGQDRRAAARFAVIALAGELATEYGLTGWAEGEAADAAAHAFRLWQSTRGKGNSERQQILQKVSDFIERHGDGRFSSAVNDSNYVPAVRDRAGWWRDSRGKREYLFTAEAMREATKGTDYKRALDALEECGALPAGNDKGERSKLTRINGRAIKLYPIDADRLGGGNHGA